MFHHAMIRGYLKPTPLKPYMTSDDHHSTSITMRKYKDKNHISHPQEKPQVTSTKGRGEEGQDGHITLGGPAKPGSYIRVCSYFLKSTPDGPSTKPCMPLRYILAQVKDKRFSSEIKTLCFCLSTISGLFTINLYLVIVLLLVGTPVRLRWV